MRSRSLPRPALPTPAVAALALAATLAVPPAARAQRPDPDAPTVENVRVGFTESIQGRYKVGTWTPVWVDLQGGRAPFDGLIEVTAPDDDGTPTSIRVRAFVQARESRRFFAVARPGTRTAEVSARVLDRQGRPVGPGWPRGVHPESLEPSAQLILTAGDLGGVAEVTKLPKFQRSTTPDLVIAPLSQWPGVWYGFDGVGAIVLETGNRGAMDRLREGADRVLRDWVAQGGHLVVALGSNWQEAREVLGPMLPAEPTEPLRLVDTDVDSIESFAGNVSRPLRPPINAVRLEGWRERGSVVLATATTTPLVVRGAFGLGRVTLIGFDVANRPMSDWEDKRFFWDKVLDLRGRVETDAVLMTSRGAIIQAAAPELAAVLHRALEAFPGVKIVPFGWVAFFVFVYILLIGPLDYLFLKRVVKRMELTWVTFPLIVVAVSVLAYLGAHAVKGDDLRVNKVDLLDFDQTTGRLRGTTWLTVFSPSNRDYGVAIRPLGSDLDPDGRSADVATTTLSWFAPPDPVLGGSGRVGFGNAGYAYEPVGEPESLRGVRIPIWSTKSFTGRWTGTGRAPAVEVDLQTTSGDRVAGSIRNLLGVPLERAQLYYGRNLYDLGTIRPRGIARVDPTRTEAMASYLGRLTGSLESRRAGPGETGREEAERASALRVDVLRAAMFHEAMGDRGLVHPNLALRSLDLTAQVSELRRPVLVAEVAAPAAALELKDAPSEPGVAQTTMIRVILPLGDGPEARPATRGGRNP